MKGWKGLFQRYGLAATGVLVLVALAMGYMGLNPNVNGDNKHLANDIAQVEDESAQSANQRALVEDGCVFVQTLLYTPCQHTVIRRVDAPVETRGLNREALAKAMGDYRIAAFGARQVEMAREYPIYCPDHWVLTADSGGEVAIWQNRLGESMEMLHTLGITVEDLPESERQSVREGLAFDSQEALEGYLESIDS